MRRLVKSFTNENGKLITCCVEDAPGDEVLVSLESPDSIGEQIITLKEAEMLYNLLGKYLSVRHFMEK